MKLFRSKTPPNASERSLADDTGTRDVMECGAIAATDRTMLSAAKMLIDNNVVKTSKAVGSLNRPVSRYAVMLVNRATRGSQGIPMMEIAMMKGMVHKVGWQIQHPLRVGSDWECRLSYSAVAERKKMVPTLA